MPELIDKEAAYNALKHEAESHGLSFSAEAYDRAARIIDQMPTIDAKPVRRGHWVLTRDEQYEYCHCSECGYDTGENWMIGSEIPYCAQCGSKNYDGGAENA